MSCSDYEYCCICGNPTGRAGRGEDSIYATRLLDGDEIGPLCEDCYAELKEAESIETDE